VVVSALAFYDLSRIRTEKIAWLDPTTLALAAILAVGCWRVLRPVEERDARDVADVLWSQILIAGTAMVWAVLHLRGRFTSSILVLALLGSMSILQVACSRWLLARGSGPSRSVLAFLSALVVAIVFSVASYPLVPGAIGVEFRGRGGGEIRRSGPLPTVIVIVMDTVRADHLSLYGYERPTTPYLAEFANRAYLFRRAIANSNWSLPSHATLLTGLLPHQHGAHTVIASIEEGDAPGEPTLGELAQQPLAPTQQTIVDRLHGLGYESGLIAANYGWLSSDTGLTRGFDYVENGPHSLVAWEPFCGPYLRHQPIAALAALYKRASASKRSGEEIVDSATNFLASTRGRPVFLLLNFMDAHGPYTSSLDAERVEELRTRFRDVRWSAANLKEYDKSIAFLDYQLRRFFAELKSLGLFEDSLIVITSDHGEQFGPSGRGLHGRDLSQASVHIPLLIKLPGQTQGTAIEELAQLADVAPTILEAVGVPIPSDFLGSPLGRHSRAVIAENYLAAGSNRPADYRVPMDALETELPTQWALFEGRWKFVRNADGRELLYDLIDDPHESADLAPRHPEITHEMGERLAALLAPSTFADHRKAIPQASLASVTIEKLKSLGYAQ
jgi:arylsulfatase A-like enzyme